MASKAFSGGEKLEAALAELAKKVGKPAALEVGFLEGATYPDGTSVPMVAATQEFGAPKRGIPPRPYFRDMISINSPNWADQIGKILVATGYDATKAMDLMGENIAGELQQSIRDFSDPPNADSTIAAKGFNSPLRDTGHMMNSVTHVVKDK